MVRKTVSESIAPIPRTLYAIGATHPDAVRPCIVPMQAVGLTCVFAFTSFEQAEFFIEQMGVEVYASKDRSFRVELVPTRITTVDFAKLAKMPGRRIKYVAINPSLRTCHVEANIANVRDLASA